MSGFLDTMYGNMTMQTWLQSQMADGITWVQYATPSACTPGDASALLRVMFKDLASPTPLHATLYCMHLMQHPVVVVVGRLRRLAVENHHYTDLDTLRDRV